MKIAGLTETNIELRAAVEKFSAQMIEFARQLVPIAELFLEERNMVSVWENEGGSVVRG